MRLMFCGSSIDQPEADSYVQINLYNLFMMQMVKQALTVEQEPPDPEPAPNTY